ncbi:MAG TPA: thiamine pyrophosphate-requiring protein [Longimicrobium sp.]|nr:thiamine pyrophosphate-requiring protein [Longimicrobium sp.]
MGDEKTVGDFLLERLEAWGIRRVFGYSGDGINGILKALWKADRSGRAPIEYVQTAHEELAALMATAHAKYTGQVGVCLATGGPGAIHLLNGMYDAKLDHRPVVAIVGQQATSGLGASAQQEVDLHTLLKDVASDFVETIVSPEQARHVIDRALRIAIARRTVTAIIIPHDVQEEPVVEDPPHEHGMQHSATGFSAPRVVPADDDLRRAAEVLNAGSRVAILAGAGALHARAELVSFAEELGAGIAKALLGKAAVPDELPYVTGTVGWLGTDASNRMLRECDTLLMVGTTFPYTEFLPKPGSVRAVQIDLDAGGLGVRYPTEVNLMGDAAETLRALLPLLERKSDRGWREDVEGWVDDWRAEEERRAHQPADPVNPQLLVHELSARLPDDAILASDSGTSTVWLARHVRMRGEMMASVSGSLATMGCAVPYALAAKLAFPDRLGVALVGDGAMQMSGINALVDVARHWRGWSDPRLVVIVFNNRDLAYVSWEQRVMDGFPKFPATQDVPDLPYASFAELLGLRGVRVEKPEDVIPAIEAALAADRPFVIDAVVDPAVPTLPPELTDEQRKTLDKALKQGDPDEDAVREQLDLQRVGNAP